MGKVRSFFRNIVRLFVFLIIAISTTMAVIYYCKWQFDRPGSFSEDIVFEIQPGQGIKNVASRLHEQNIIEGHNCYISKECIFILGAYINDSYKQLKVGEYNIPANSSMAEIISILTSGKSISYSITFPEGYTSQQIIEKINVDSILTGDIKEIPAEGTLLPETYKFTKGMTKEELIKRMKKAQKIFLKNIWDKRKNGLPYKNIDEAIILASIVEKETGVKSERKKVAGVFVNRLRKKMKLQSDPTIIYGLVKGKAKLGRPITKSDLQKKTEYNTYHIEGLPPTPIANPGKASLSAALNPDDTDALYFVADGTGGHAFASTLEEHNKNVAKWREIEKRLKEENSAKESLDNKKIGVE